MLSLWNLVSYSGGEVCDSEVCHSEVCDGEVRGRKDVPSTTEYELKYPYCATSSKYVGLRRDTLEFVEIRVPVF